MRGRLIMGSAVGIDVGTTDCDGVEPGTVVEVHRAGFADSAGRLVRPAVVTVAQETHEE
jgi:molecular chaperone GrpE (heat shock protein)